MSIKRYTVRLEGTSPLVMHNNQCVNPLNPLKKEIAAITGRRKKTESDYRQLFRLEFQASLYINSQGPFIPFQNLRKMLIEGARKSKDGKQFESGAWVEKDAQVEYEGPRDLESLIDDGRFMWTTPVGNQKNTVMRTRARFEQWACEFNVDIEESLIQHDMLVNALHHAEFIGICDGRSIGCGRFDATLIVPDESLKASGQVATEREVVTA